MKAYPNIQLTVSEMGQVRAINEVNTGMDLRDYFAICFAETQINLIKDSQFDALETFKTSYKLADIMMKAREVK
jgi:hypothetical protein